MTTPRWSNRSVSSSSDTSSSRDALRPSACSVIVVESAEPVRWPWASQRQAIGWFGPAPTQLFERGQECFLVASPHQQAGAQQRSLDGLTGQRLGEYLACQ